MIWRGASQPHLRNELQGNALWRWTWAEVENESIGRWWKWCSSDFRGLIIMSRSKISISQPLNWGDDAWGADSEIVPLSDTPNNKLDQKHNNHYRGTIISSREPPTLVNELGSAEESLNENNKLSICVQNCIHYCVEMSLRLERHLGEGKVKVIDSVNGTAYGELDIEQRIK